LIPTDEQRALQEAARRFAREQLLPLYQKREREARMDRALLRELGQLGFIGMDVSTKYGGMGCDAVTTGLVIMFLWKQFYDPTPHGLLNQIVAIFARGLRFLGLHLHPAPIDWLGDPRMAMVAVIVPIVWAGMGPGCLIYLAALRGIPEEIYEAADLDGAGILSKVRNVTLPYLKPLIIINFVGAFIAAARSFDAVFVTTGGGPVFSTHVAGLEIWMSAFLYLKFGYAVAMAWIVGALLVGFTLFQLRILSRVQFKTAEA